MHLLLVLMAVMCAIAIRLSWRGLNADWNTRWQTTLGAFLFSPLLLITSTIALLWMGPRGQMVRWWEGWGIYAIAVGFLIGAIVALVKLAIDAGRSIRRVHDLPLCDVQSNPARLLQTSTPFIAQIGFWNPELVISQGLLDTLDAEHLAVAITHEQAHQYYRDTFWFFWLGWLRRLTHWLPNTEAMWQELIMLRELRADRWAVHVDSEGSLCNRLLLAEALLSVIQAAQVEAEPWAAAFGQAIENDRLTERINALLDENAPFPQPIVNVWIALSFVLIPLMIVPFHFR